MHTACWLTVLELQNLIVDGWSHADGLAREIGVVVESFSDCDSSWRLAVSCQQAEHIVLSTMSEWSKEQHHRCEQVKSPLPQTFMLSINKKLTTNYFIQKYVFH